MCSIVGVAAAASVCALRFCEGGRRGPLMNSSDLSLSHEVNRSKRERARELEKGTGEREGRRKTASFRRRFYPRRVQLLT